MKSGLHVVTAHPKMPPAFVTPLSLFRRGPGQHRPSIACTPRRPRQPIIRCASGQDHYKVLDIPETADSPAVKRAYRRAALKNHPDVSDAPDARERFLRVQEAYAVLSDPSKRASYDRRRSSPFTSPSGVPGFDGFSGFDSDFARRWREKNPIPEDIDDSLGSIFSDLFTGVADVVGGSNGIVEDFIDFLEKRVDGFRDDGLADILSSKDLDVLETELEDARFVMKQLKSRKARAVEEESSLNERAEEWRKRAERAEAKRDYDVRQAAEQRQTELKKEAARFKDRASKTAKLVEDQEERVRKIGDRLDEVRREEAKSKASTPGKATRTPKNQQEAIDDELERMKKELGL